MSELFGSLTGISIIVAAFAAWITHVVVTIKAGAYLLLFVGAFFFPVGIVHGLMIWFGIV